MIICRQESDRTGRHYNINDDVCSTAFISPNEANIKMRLEPGTISTFCADSEVSVNSDYRNLFLVTSQLANTGMWVNECHFSVTCVLLSSFSCILS